MGNLNESVNVIKKYYPDRKLLGYWVENGNYIFRITPTAPGAEEPVLFIVEKGQVLPVLLPFQHPVVLKEKMKFI